jgi:hypothetical protein
MPRIEGQSRIYFRDKGYETDYRLLQKKLPGREVIQAGSTADDVTTPSSVLVAIASSESWMIAASSDRRVRSPVGIVGLSSSTLSPPLGSPEERRVRS